MKKLLYQVSLFCLIAVSVQAREIRTPLPLYYAPYHYPTVCCDTGRSWNIDLLGGAYYRSAQDLGALIFGADNFTLAQAFPQSSTGGALSNPFVTISTLSPRFEYTEHGAMFGANFCKYLGDDRWHFGVRARIPVRDITVEEVCGGNNLTGETLADVFQTRTETIDVDGIVSSNTVFSARLDFLSALPGTPESLVIYSDPDASGHLSIAHIDSTGNIPTGGPVANNMPPVAVIARTDSSLPTGQPWGNVNTSITGVVAADGSGLADNQRGRFASDNNYAPLAVDISHQSKLFIVPTINNVALPGDPIAQTNSGANQILNAIQSSIGALDSSVVSFIQEQKLDFCAGRSKGLGDVDIELFGGYVWGCERRVWTDLLLGARLPTADRLCDCTKILKQPLGNNGHVEVRTGAQIGYDALSWLKFNITGRYSWVLKRSETIAAPFTGATIKNIGPCVKADISWNYFIGDFDITLSASDCCGCDIGYEFYYKSCDKISLCARTATDFALRPEQPLDARVAARCTKVLAHKIRAEFFMATGVCELFSGFEQVVAGSNTLRDTDWYAGLRVRF